MNGEILLKKKILCVVWWLLNNFFCSLTYLKLKENCRFIINFLEELFKRQDVSELRVWPWDFQYRGTNKIRFDKFFIIRLYGKAYFHYHEENKSINNNSRLCYVMLKSLKKTWNDRLCRITTNRWSSHAETKETSSQKFLTENMNLLITKERKMIIKKNHHLKNCWKKLMRKLMLTCPFSVTILVPAEYSQMKQTGGYQTNFEQISGKFIVTFAT